MKRRYISTKNAPQPVAAYSQAIKVKDFNSLVFISGQVGIDSENGKLVEGGIKAETRQTLENIKAILKESSATFEDVVKVSVFLNDIEKFKEMNEVYEEYFGDSKPARAAFEVADLAKNFQVEIEAIAAL